MRDDPPEIEELPEIINGICDSCGEEGIPVRSFDSQGVATGICLCGKCSLIEPAPDIEPEPMDMMPGDEPW